MHERSGHGVHVGMNDFISEPIEPVGGHDTVAMGQGLPGLPKAFMWRGEKVRVASVMTTWKASSAEGGRPGGERYLRRHYFRLRMNSGDAWTVYFLRQTPRSGSPKARWFLYSIEEPV